MALIKQTACTVPIFRISCPATNPSPFLILRYQWSLDKVTLSDGRGKTLSFCKELAGGQFLPSGIPITFKFKNGDCIMKSALPAQAYGFLENKKVRVDCYVMLGFPICTFFDSSKI